MSFKSVYPVTNKKYSLHTPQVILYCLYIYFFTKFPLRPFCFLTHVEIEMNKYRCFLQFTVGCSPVLMVGLAGLLTVLFKLH